MDKLYDTPLKAIRKKCMDCSNDVKKEVRLCPIVSCPIWPYRFGKKPTEPTIDTIKSFYDEKVEPA